jgi:hypothetical protein
MPCTYKIDVAARLIRGRAWGELTNEDVHDYYHRLVVDPRFHPAFRHLTCLDEVSSFALNAWMIAEASSWPVFDVGTRRAIVARADAGYGLARMFSLHAERVGQNVRVFRGGAEAQAWLDSPAEPGREPDISPIASPDAQRGAA